jgi:hypothetical protein
MDDIAIRSTVAMRKVTEVTEVRQNTASSHKYLPGRRRDLPAGNDRKSPSCGCNRKLSEANRRVAQPQQAGLRSNRKLVINIASQSHAVWLIFVINKLPGPATHSRRVKTPTDHCSRDFQRSI